MKSPVTKSSRAKPAVSGASRRHCVIEPADRLRNGMAESRYRRAVRHQEKPFLSARVVSNVIKTILGGDRPVASQCHSTLPTLQYHNPMMNETHDLVNIEKVLFSNDYNGC